MELVVLILLRGEYVGLEVGFYKGDKICCFNYISYYAKNKDYLALNLRSCSKA